MMGQNAPSSSLWIRANWVVEVQMPERQNCKYHDMLEEWAGRNLMKFNTDKYHVLYQG